MHGRVLILAGCGGHISYAYVLAQALNEKVPFSFLVPEADILREGRPRKFGEVDYLIESQGPKTLRTTKKSLKVLKDVEKNLDRYDQQPSCPVF
jgi:UDP-N-acetylglucosamine:LPS N-acetylglucosamine transferase